MENDGLSPIVCGLDGDRSASCWRTDVDTPAPYRLRDQPRLVGGSSSSFVLGIDEAGRLWQWEFPNNAYLMEGPTLVVIPP
jgi:hypothetical protein